MAAKKNELDFLFVQYQALSARRINHNKILWELPALFLAIQSFLIGLSFGLSIEAEWWIRLVLTLVAFFLGILALQTFERNRIMEIADAEQLYDIEKHLLSLGYSGIVVHHKLQKRKYLNGNSIGGVLEDQNQLRWYNHTSSFRLWRLVMCGLIIISLLASVYHFILNAIPK